MRVFNTIREFVDYIPNCLICNKPMNIQIESVLTPISGSKSRWNAGNDRIILRMALKEGILQSDFKRQSVTIDPDDNCVTMGADLTSRFSPTNTYAKKLCSTCVFKISAYAFRWDKVKKNHLPPMYLKEESINFTLKRGRQINIQKWYSNIDDDQNHLFGTSAAVATSVRIDGKPFETQIALEFDKFHNFVQLGKRIKTMMVFQ